MTTSGLTSVFNGGLLVQAELIEKDAQVMLQDAEAKKQAAYELDPSLAPKKGPGRPPKQA